MQTIKLNLSSKTSLLLSQYPEWVERIDRAISQEPFKIGYSSHIVEVFDQHGLLAGRVNGCFSYESTREPEQESEFIAWLLDGELALFYVGSELIINRLQILATAFGELL
ncbi:hypothetical protein [Calothrix sp. UHCC 0171]|uniref:hypothetical protein n=1 Tax=Calothrix sp. UHCC 0171 TaxID=3110245 RepID=UPI002B1EBC62|nr:hypothetical protein [Calothrix sp. UHCC 0171]MEA5573431.1 hypothetical protein [Calothrix sp. UHCC 0171]